MAPPPAARWPGSTAAFPRASATAVRTCRPRSPPACSCRRRWPAAARAGTPVFPAGACRASGVSGGMRPSGGSTISDVRRPIGLCDRKIFVAVRAADVLLASLLVAPDVLADDGRALLVQLGTLFVGEEFLVGVARRPLQRDLVRVRPDALQIRRAPGCLRSGSGGPFGCGWRLSVQDQNQTAQHSRDTDGLEKSCCHVSAPRRP